MAYIKNNWVDREGTTRYFETVDDDGALIFTPDYTQVTELGTPVNADNMNHIEEGIAAGSFTKYDTKATYALNDLVTVIEEASPVIYKSLQDNNIGNALSNSAYWEKISLGGGGGLEIGDIGIAPLGIDETKGKRRYLNGQVIIQEQYVQFTNKVKSAVALYPSLACTESEWQITATMTVGGQVGKFVVDDEAGTIRLPKIIMPIQGLTDLSKLGEIVEAGLPNITGSIDNIRSTMADTQSGVFTKTDSTNIQHGTTNNVASRKFSFDASLSNPIYGNSNTVQQEQIQYPYFIQVATGAETEDNIINEIELNNPFSFGDSKYSPVALNNLSWLKSEGQYNSKAVYPSFYDWALINANNGVERFKFVTDEYTDYDWVLNTADETFRLPLLDGSESFPSDKTISLKSSLTSSGQTFVAPANGWYSLALSSAGSETQKYIALKNMTSGVVSLPRSFGGTSGTFSLAVFVYAKKGDTILVEYTDVFGFKGAQDNFIFSYAQGNGSLYFYVGETVQNANLINAGRIEEKLANYTTHNMVDGQWEGFDERILLSDAKALGTHTIDVSEILPKDNYNYMLVINYGLYRNDSSNSNTNLAFMDSKGRTVSTDMVEGFGSAFGAKGVALILIDSSRKFSYGITGVAASTYELYVSYYRRVGTNK